MMVENSSGFDPEKPTVTFDYIKSPSFQSMRVDGAIGGITPTNRIHMAVYSERPAIPRRVTYEITPSGELGSVTEVESRNSIVREMSADLFLDLTAAKAIADWLSERIQEVETKELPNE